MINHAVRTVDKKVSRRDFAMKPRPRILILAFGFSLCVHAALFAALAMSYSSRMSANPRWELPAGEAQGVIAYLAPVEVEEEFLENDIVIEEPEDVNLEAYSDDAPIEPLKNTFTEPIEPAKPNSDIAREWLALNTQELILEAPTVQPIAPRVVNSQNNAESVALAVQSENEFEVANEAHPAHESQIQGGTPGVTERPVPDARNKPPKYPASSRRAKETGTVLLHVLINANGRVSKLSILQSSGFDALDRAALAAVQDWRFSPATENGTAIESHVKLPIVFVLK